MRLLISTPRRLFVYVAIYAAGPGEAVRTRRRQLVTHHIGWVEDRLLVVDTGHNGIPFDELLLTRIANARDTLSIG